MGEFAPGHMHAGWLTFVLNGCRPGNVIFQNGFDPSPATQAVYHNHIGMLVRV